MQRNRSILETTRARAVPILVLTGIALTLAACSSDAVHTDAVARGGLLAPALDGLSAPAEGSTAGAIGPSVIGLASWYRRGPLLQRTCTGEPLLDGGLSAASPVLPMGTVVRVALLHEDRSVIVRIDDCMPRGHRIIDLSVEAARELGLLERGVALVRVTPVAWQ